MIAECKNCKYFIQHYTLNKTRGLFDVSCGHCMKRKNINKRLSCEYYEATSNDNLNLDYDIMSLLLRTKTQCEKLINELDKLNVTIS